MAANTTIETRLAKLEEEVAELKRRANAPQTGNWLEQISGSQANEPEFERVLELGREARRADRPTD